MSGSDELRRKVLAAAAAAPSPTRAEVRTRNALLIGSAVAMSAAIFLMNGGFRPTGRPPELSLRTSLGSLCVAACVVFVALGRGRSMLGRSGSWLFVCAALTPFALLAWKVAISAGYPGAMVEWPHRMGFRCLGLSLASAAFPLAALLMARRHSDPTHPRLTGAAIGAAVGASSWFLVDLWCPVAFFPHLLLGHVLPLVGVTLLGLFVGGRSIALRAH